TAHTDAEGKFRLAQMHPDAHLVFVEKDGYRPTGDMIPRSGALRITVEALSAPASAPLRSIRWPREKRQTLLKDLLTPILPRLGDGGSDYFLEEALKRLAPYDGAFVLIEFDRLRNNRSRANVLAALGAVDDALEHAALVKDPYR